MRKLALLALCAGASLAVPSIAAAATPQGKLTGSATVALVSWAIGNTVTDGETDPLYIGKENDKSGNCNGDSGTVIVVGTTYNVVCAHYVAASGCCNPGSPKMRFAVDFGASPFRPRYGIQRITDNGDSDTFMAGGTNSLTDAQAWVNVGRVGSGQSQPWGTFGVSNSSFTVTP